MLSSNVFIIIAIIITLSALVITHIYLSRRQRLPEQQTGFIRQLFAALLYGWTLALVIVIIALLTSFILATLTL